MLSFVKSAAKNSLIYGLGNVSTKVVGFILLPLYTSHLSVREYGILGLLEVSSQVIVSVFGLSLTYAFFRWYWDKEYIEARRSIMFTCMVCLFTVAAGMVCLTIIFAKQLSVLLFDSPQYSLLMVLLSISAAMQIMASIPSSLMQLQQRAVLFSVANTVQLTTSLLGTILFVATLNMNVLGIYIAQIIGSAVYFLLLSKFITENITFLFSWKILKGMLLVSLPLVFSSISGVVINVADRYMLRYFDQLSDVGLYSLGYKIANTVNIFVVMSINLAIAPMLYKIMDDPNNKRIYSKVMTYAALGVMLCVIGISFVSREAIRLVAQNPDYWDAYKIVPFISIAIYFGMLRDISAIGLNLRKKTKVISLIVVTVSITNILGNAIFIPLWQTIGASISALLSQFLFFILMYIFAQRHYYVPYEWKKILFISMLGMAIVGLGLIVQEAPIAISFLLKCFLLFSFPLVLYFFNYFEPVEIERLYGAWIKWNNPLGWKKNIRELFNNPSA
jgi:O-antigen/teichoic acid export membrane protein